MATSTPWAAAPRTRQDLTSSTCFNTSLVPTAGRRRLSTFPDNQMNNMACGVLTVSGTPHIYCVGGSAAGQTTATARVFSYNPVTDTPTTLDRRRLAGRCRGHDSAGRVCSG